MSKDIPSYLFSTGRGWRTGACPLLMFLLGLQLDSTRLQGFTQGSAVLVLQAEACDEAKSVLFSSMSVCSD